MLYSDQWMRTPSVNRFVMWRSSALIPYHVAASSFDLIIEIQVAITDGYRLITRALVTITGGNSQHGIVPPSNLLRRCPVSLDDWEIN